jgi:hypothetical protein
MYLELPQKAAHAAIYSLVTNREGGTAEECRIYFDVYGNGAVRCGVQCVCQGIKF